MGADGGRERKRLCDNFSMEHMERFSGGRVPRWEMGVSRSRILLLIAAIVAPAIWTESLLVRYEIGVPFADDYVAILGFALKYRAQSSAAAKWLMIFTDQYQEYKPTFAHLLLALDMSLFGRVHKEFLDLLGNAFLVPIGWMLWRSCFPRAWPLQLRLTLFVPVSLLLFTPVYWEAMDWAAAGLLYTPALTFGIAALYLLVPGAGKPGKRPGLAAMAGASVAAILLCLTSPGGFLLYPVGLWFGVLGGQAKPWKASLRRAWAQGVCWTGAFAVGYVPYVFHYQRYDSGTKRSALHSVVFAMGVAGSMLPRVNLALAAAVAMVGVAALAVRLRFDRVNPRMCSLAIWMGATCLLVGAVRDFPALIASIESRYSIHSLLLAICCYSFAVHVVRQWTSDAARLQLVYAAAVLFTLGFFVTEMSAVRLLLATRRTMMVKVCLNNLRQPGGSGPDAETWAEQRSALAGALKAGIYTLPDEVRRDEADEGFITVRVPFFLGKNGDKPRGFGIHPQ